MKVGRIGETAGAQVLQSPGRHSSTLHRFAPLIRDGVVDAGADTVSPLPPMPVGSGSSMRFSREARLHQASPALEQG